MRMRHAVYKMDGKRTLLTAAFCVALIEENGACVVTAFGYILLFVIEIYTVTTIIL